MRRGGSIAASVIRRIGLENLELASLCRSGADFEKEQETLDSKMRKEARKSLQRTLIQETRW